MNKKTYLRRLRQALGNLPEREKEKFIEYYSEMIDEALERGRTEKEVFADLDLPEQVASDYLRERDGENAEQDSPRKESGEEDSREESDSARASGEKRARKPMSGGKLLLIILLFPLWLPLLCVAFSLALAAFIVVLALFVAVFAIVVAFFAGGIYLIVMSFGILGTDGNVAAAQIGAGLILIGLSLLFGILVPSAVRGLVAFVCWVFRGFRRSKKERAAGSPKGKLISALVGLVLLFAGALTGAIGMGNLGWDWRKLAAIDDFEERTQTLSFEEIESLTVNSDNLSLTVKYGEGEAKLVYFESPDLPKTFSFENGVLTLNSGKWFNSFGGTMDMAWNYGVFASAVTSVYCDAVLYLPQDYAGALSVTVSNGKIVAENLTLGDVSFTTSNGYVKAEGGTYGSLAAKSSNGYLKFTDVKAGTLRAETSNSYTEFIRVKAGVLFGKTQNGAIRLEGADAGELELKSGNGAVSGTLAGKKGDYRITASTGNGSCNLSNTETGERTLSVRTGNGTIRISFLEQDA